ncbi:MAG: S9 family peptidase [Vicinamibacterales bacterium]
MAPTSTPSLTPPVAKRVEKHDLLHGERRDDPYFWLRDRSDPDVRTYLEAENAYADAVLQPTDALREQVYGEMLARIKQTDLSVPYRERGYLYYARTQEGLQYPIHCRRPAHADDARTSTTVGEQVLVDGNELSRGRAFFSLGAMTVSDAGDRLAYTTDFTGYREYTLWVLNLATRTLEPTSRDKVTSVAWAADGRTLFYTVEDHAKRSYRLYRWTIGSSEPDTLVVEEVDERFSVYVERSRSGAYLFLQIASHTTSEVHVVPADRPESAWRLVAPRQQDVEYDLDHREDRFYIRVNDTGRNFRIVSAPVDTPERDAWQELVPHRRDVMIEGLLAFRGHVVLCERERGLTELTIWDVDTGGRRRIAFTEPAYQASASTNREYDTHTFRYEYESFITPRSVYDYDLRTHTSVLLKRTEVLGGYDPSRYASERIEATAADGVTVPISLLYRADVERNGRAPILLTGYGAYGLPSPITFSSNVFSLVDRGVVFAVGHVRGGGDLGKPWHDDGRMLRKMNTFTDFITVADHLVEAGYGARHRLVVAGGSAGGLLVGAVLNLRPDVCRAAILWVPFVDVVNTMLDADLPLTVGEFEEWGDPRVPAEYAYMKAYCPYTNLARGSYPSMLVRTSYHDSQVMFWEPAKYVARLRTLKTDDRPLLLKTNMAAGHGGSSGRYDRLKETALDYAFVLSQVGLTT